MKQKFPKTFHLSFSKTISSDDKVLDKSCLKNLEGRDIIVLEKLDGENTTLYHDGLHARSIDSAHNWTRDYITKKWAEISYLIKPELRIVCENVFAKHSIYYEENRLKDYVYLISAIEAETVLSWKDILLLSEKLDIPTPEIFYEGVFDLKALQNIAKKLDPQKQEGFVFRVKESFSVNDYNKLVGKYVRANHVATDKHWLQNTYPNGKPQKLLQQKQINKI